MKKLLQIDSSLCVGSTGRISEAIAKLAQQQDWECYIVHGARYAKRPSCMIDIQSVSTMGEYLHYAEGLLFDNHGLASRKATKTIIEKIKQIRPDMIQLHCVHGYYINYKLLFEYLNATNIPIVWTFHDCWAFTGHCAHFVTVGCEKWKNEGCHDCPLKGDYPKSFVDFSKRNYELKKKLFTANNNLHIVPVSDWLADLTKQSFLRGKDIQVICNGVDINTFKPLNNKKSDKYRILGVSGVWNKGKGLFDFYKLRKLLDKNQYEIVLIGLTKDQLKDLPDGIIGVERTNSAAELAAYYSSANVFVNPTYADSLPTVNMEALACGTPVITYNTGGSPEIIDKKTGIVVEQGDLKGLVDAIKKMRSSPLSPVDCRNRAVVKYDNNKRFADYVNFYNELIKR